MADTPIRRILVTGASGFVGGHLLPALRARLPGAEVLSPWFDVTDAAAADAAVRQAMPDAVVHLAAIAAIPEAQRDPDATWRVNLHGTLGLARAVLSHAPRCVFVFAGSADAYGASFRGGGRLTEAAVLAPLNTYGATKAAADLALGAMVGGGLRCVRVRPFNHTGAGQSDGFVVAAFARQVARIAAGRQPPVIEVGALDPRRDFLDVRDVCAGYAECVARGGALEPGLILNLASGVPRRIGDVLDALLQRAGIRPEIRTDPGRLRGADIDLAWGDASRAADLLGWAPRVAWEETLRRVLDDWRARTHAGRAQT